MRAQSNSYFIGGFMALLTLMMVVILPMISHNDTTSSQPLAPALLSPHMQALENQRTALVQIESGTLYRGTMPDEAEAAAAQCADYGLTCDPASAEDSYPAHQIQVGSLWMEMNEVTYGQYVTFLNTLGAGTHAEGCAGERCVITQVEDPTSSIVFNGVNYVISSPAVEDYPVVDVTWYGAQAYCEALGRRLPTETEWEYAARGPAGTLYPWGNQWNPEAANVRGTHTANGVIIAEPQPVGGYSEFASRDGVRDLAGNVAEWVADWYAPDNYLRGEIRPAEGTERVVRGGSWNKPFFYARSVQRDSLLPGATSASVGFRCVAD